MYHGLPVDGQTGKKRDEIVESNSAAQNYGAKEYMAIISLNEMKGGESGLIREIRGGYGFVKRMDSMNVRVGKRITKLTSLFRGGPVTVQIDNSQLALGYGMAGRILVEVNR